jgi:acyl carrier protein
MNSEAQQLERLVRESLRKFKYVSSDGSLIALDSLALIDVVTILEEATGIPMPAERLELRNFDSIESLAELLVRLREAPAL